jgi:hypothetical protein
MDFQLDLFSTRQYQNDLFGAEYITKRIHSNLESGPIEFYVKESREYFDLSETILSVKVKIVKADGTPIPAVGDGKDNVALINNSMHSIFSDAQIILNGKPIEGVPDGLYPYRAYFPNLLNYSKEVQIQQLFSQGFVRDDYTNMDSTANTAFTIRKGWNVIGAEKTFYGKLYCGLFQQRRLLIPGVELILRLERAKDSFAIFNANPALKPKIVITDAKLHLLTIKVNPAILQHHALILGRGMPAIYEFNRTEIFTIPYKAFTTEESKDELFHMQIPKYMLMFMVGNSAFHGDYSKNPFNLKHYALKSLHLTRDDESVPFERFEPDFKNGNCLKEFIAQYQSNDLLGKNALLPINYDEFKSGYTIFQWNLSDNRKGVNAGPAQRGNLKIDFAFEDPTPEAFVMVMYGIFESTIQVFGNDQVLVDGV